MPRLLLALLWIMFALIVRAAPAKPVNLVFILTDNQGAWTLGCYGNPVCSPTRATFLTGLIPSQHGVHSFLDPKFMMGPQAYNTLAEFRSLGEILRDAGYTCGLSGKWHLGANLTPSEGFSFWVTKPDGHTKEFYHQDVIEHGVVRQEAGYTTDLWTRRGVAFIEENKARPFFLFLAYNGPYALGGLLGNKAKNRHAAYYADKELPSFPREPMHPWQRQLKAYHNNAESIRRVAAEVSGVDDGVGEIMATLERHGLTENTLVVYTSDQGWMGGQNGRWGMGDHSRPVGAHELMMQIPFVFHQPGRIPAGATSDALVSNYDFLPSVLGHLGLADKMPVKPKSPGRDFSPILHGKEILWDQAVFYEFETCRAIRTERWKLVLRQPAGPHELYDMAADPQERTNRFGEPGTAATTAGLHSRLEAFFREYSTPEYDIWAGGRSKASRATGK
jgi:arylsulfatase A-like enzyme